ncbi:MAG: rhodanese-like domain-containing protein [Nisaea sp.]|uniref:rhodanese-like domain-containing protein n=1 Tax=Nisaea sp. TaxID=2024842 RepID=UPI0032984BF2
MFGLLLGSFGQVFANDAAQSTKPMVAVETSGFATLDSAKLASMMQNKDFLLVDVHVPYEGEIDGTDKHIVFYEIADNLDKLPSDKSARIVLYCRSGRMSEIAAAELAGLGYTRVSHLAGGMIAWEKAGNAVVDKRP